MGLVWTVDLVGIVVVCDIIMKGNVFRLFCDEREERTADISIDVRHKMEKTVLMRISTITKFKTPSICN